MLFGWELIGFVTSVTGIRENEFIPSKGTFVLRCGVRTALRRVSQEEFSISAAVLRGTHGRMKVAPKRSRKIR
jgi:hypothetical protein